MPGTMTAATCVQIMPSNSNNRQQTKAPERPLSVVRRGSTPLYKGRASPTAEGQQPVFPEKELLNRYRHVYAGRGGWYGYKNGSHGPINQNSQNSKAASLRYIDKYRREILQKLSKTLSTNPAKNGQQQTLGCSLDRDDTKDFKLTERQTDKVDQVKDAQKVDGDRTRLGIGDVQSPAPSTENDPESWTQSTELRTGDEDVPGTERDPSTKTNSINNEVNSGKVITSMSEVCVTYYSGVSTDPTVRSAVAVTNTNTTDSSYEPPEIDRHSVQTSARVKQQKTSPSLPSSGPRPILNRATEDSATEIQNEVQPAQDSDNIHVACPLHNVTKEEQEDFDGTGTRRKNEPEEVVALRTARSCPSRLDQGTPPCLVKSRTNEHSTGQSRHPLTSRTHRQGRVQSRLRSHHRRRLARAEEPSSRRKLDVFSRMSQEARWAITETRREMGLKEIVDCNVHNEDLEASLTEHPIVQTQTVTCDSDSNRTEADNSSYRSGLSDELEEVMNRVPHHQQRVGMELLESGRYCYPGYRNSRRDRVTNKDQGDPQVATKSRPRKTRRGVTVQQTRETAITASEFPQQEQHQQQQQQQRQDEQQEQGLSQQKSRKERHRSRKPQQPGSLLYRRPMTKLPEISGSETRDSVGGEFLPNSPRLMPGRRIPGVGQYRVVPNSKMRREGTFEITPVGYDSRFRDLRRHEPDFKDDTPEEVKAKAIEKCKEWLNKYWV